MCMSAVGGSLSTGDDGGQRSGPVPPEVGLTPCRSSGTVHDSGGRNSEVADKAVQYSHEYSTAVQLYSCAAVHLYSMYYFKTILRIL